MYKIFIVEDDTRIREELSTLLSRYGYECIVCDDFKNIIEHIKKSDAQLVLLDINLPYFDGYHICRELRKQSSIPIIIVTSRDSDIDELMSINLGADDFVTKPYNTEILIARIASVLNRAYQINSTMLLEHNGVKLDVAQSQLQFEGNSIELTKNECRILNLLMQNKNQIITRDEIINDLWQTDEFVDDNTLTVNINRLRKKLSSVGVVDFLLTKRGLGYMV